MPSVAVKIYEKIFIAIFLYILVQCAYVDITTQPAPGDNWDYHIPIAQQILKGNIFHPIHFLDKWYYPGSSEFMLSILILLHLPMNLFNLLALILLFFLTRKLAIKFGQDSPLATIYAVVVVSLPTIYFRLLSSTSIDLWLANYIIGIVLLLKSPQNKLSYFTLLGFLFGMLMGTKYSGLIYAIFLLVLYAKNFIKYITLKRFVVFCFLVFLTGGTWYIRNFLYTGNPFFPEASGIFPHSKHTISSVLVYQGWRVLLFVPNGATMMLDAILSEAKMWAFVLPAIPILFFIKTKQKKAVQELILISLFGLFVFLISPSWYEYDPLVSSFRYSYTFFTFAILSVFLFIQDTKKMEYLVLLSFVNILLFPPITFHAKTMFLFLPLVLLYALLSTKTTLSMYPPIKKGIQLFKTYAL